MFSELISTKHYFTYSNNTYTEGEQLPRKSYIFKNDRKSVLVSPSHWLGQLKLWVLYFVLKFQNQNLEELVGQLPHNFLVKVATIVEKDQSDTLLAMVLKQVVDRVWVVAGESLCEGGPGIAVPRVGFRMLIFEFLMHKVSHLDKVEKLSGYFWRVLFVEN